MTTATATTTTGRRTGTSTHPGTGGATIHPECRARNTTIRTTRRGKMGSTTYPKSWKKNSKGAFTSAKFSTHLSSAENARDGGITIVLYLLGRSETTTMILCCYYQGTPTEGEGTVDLLIQIACFVKVYNVCIIKSSLTTQEDQLYWAFLLVRIPCYYSSFRIHKFIPDLRPCINSLYNVCTIKST